MDKITARNEPMKPWAKAPEGQHQGVLVDVIDLGYHNKVFQGKAKGFKQYCALVWQIDAINPDTGKRFEMSREFQVTMFELAGLRKLLEQWRGKSYSPEEAEKGAPLHLLEGHNGLIQVEHKQSVANPERTYANIISVTPLPRAMEKMAPDGYVRSEHWKDKMGATAFPEPPATNLGRDTQDFDDFPQELEDDNSDLPF